MNDLSPIEIATRLQGRAANPESSVWVSASAGSGKTRVLIERVLALMLTGTAPQRILCLTFTKAAAAEMANRIAEKLSGWVTAADADVIDDLKRLLHRDPGRDDIKVARQLFARVLETPGGMKIQTIHAFCQSVLRRFPLEAGLAPHFDLMTDEDAAEVLDSAREAVIAHANTGDDPALAAALSRVVARVHETMFEDLMKAITFDRAKITRLLDHHGGLAGTASAVRALLGVGQCDTPESITCDACASGTFDEMDLVRAALALSAGSKTDVERSVIVGAWLEANLAKRIDIFPHYLSAFLTKGGDIRKSHATKRVIEAHPGTDQILAAEASRLHGVLNHIRAAQTALDTEALLTLGGAFLKTYEAHKISHARLDYDDLIERTRTLLRRPGVAAWVLFKLDGGLDHLLIDEAQDTSPDQWDVVQALTDEFFAGVGRHEDVSGAERTVFAVGDRKQSIYSFQGADPEGFDRMSAYFKDRVEQATRTWEPIQLDVSFRSTLSVLRAVDAVFAAAGAREGVVRDYETLTHLIARDGHAGLVELWPPVDPEEADDPAPWKPPVERMRGDSPQTRLARLMAQRIKQMCGGELLESKNRPIHPGDILVLVRRRSGFVDDLVRALKDAGIQVAGVDRMVLIDQMAVMDLVTLGRFLLLPQDDMTLATVLRSPLIGLSEDQLFALAHGRGDVPLWTALSERAGEESDFGRAQGVLEDLLGKTDFLGPFALYAHVLTARGGRVKLLSRLGMEADDPIDEFLGQAIEYERRHTPSLEGFLHWLEHGSLEIKRDLEQATRDAVRIMTVHGAKGLQAPIVFLPDTLQMPKQGDTLFWAEDTAGAPVVIWPALSDDQDDVTRAVKDNLAAARAREYKRLLYVAMTRAEDRLYVCGWNTRNKAPQECWYNLVADALKPIADEIEEALFKDIGGGTLWRATNAQTAVPDTEQKPEDETIAIDAFPDWLRVAVPPDPLPPQPLAPSKPAEAEPPVNSPLSTETSNRFRRGLLIHRLLQSLPDLPVEKRRAAATIYLSRPAWGLSDDAVTDIANETLAVLDAPEFAAVFGPGSKAEVPLTGLIGGQVLSGQVDRLAVTDEDVLIIDYKTNRPPPTDVAGIAPAYVFQMAAYRAALREIYPDRAVRCVLLWTDGPFVMTVPDEMMDKAWQESGRG